MDVQNLREKYPKLIAFLEENEYSRTYIRRFEREINCILSRAKSEKWNSYTDVYLFHTKRSKSIAFLREKRGIIGAIERFDLENIYPGRSHRSQILKETAYDLLSEEFKAVITTYRTVGKKDKKENTIYVESLNTTTFLLSLQENNIFSLISITEKAVLDTFYQNGKLRRGHSYKKNVAAVIKACIPYFPDNICATVLSYLPALRKRRKNIQYLTKEETSRIKAVLTGMDPSLSLRDKAIGLLAFYTGLRSCDIAGLELSDIDWNSDLIHIRQQKTAVPLTLPLRAIVGNAIYDYLINERPRTECQNVFVTQAPAFTKLQNGSLYNISLQIMKAGNIRTTPGDRKGFHLFRHHMAISLLENGIPQPVISQTMGHGSPASLNPYLSADFSHLKECALSIECFPIRKEVLS